MFSVNDFLDRAKRGAGIESDYALAKAVGVSRANVSNWRNERNAPDERAILALCKLSGDDPADVALRIQAMRAANDDAAGLWEAIADRLKKAGHAVLLLPAFALLLIALAPADVQAATSQLAPSAVSLCVMSNLLRRFLMRLGALWLRNRPTAQQHRPAF